MNSLFNAACSLVIRAIFLVAILLAVSCSVVTPLQAQNFDVDSQSDYQAMLDGVRAAEYVRQAYLEDRANPRALIASAALWAFAERNPLATPGQLAEFVAQFDLQISQVLPGDPDLNSSGAIFAALASTPLSTAGPLAGTDTRVGPMVLDLLGLSLGGVFNYEQSRQRMAQFDIAAVQRLISRRETIDMLASLLSGRTPGGDRMGSLAETANAYLTLQALPPFLGQVATDERYAQINAGLADLPEYQEFLQIREQPFDELDIDEAILDDIAQLQLQGDSILSELNSPQPDLGEFQDALALTQAAADPTHPDHAAALALIQAREQALVVRTREIAAQRSRLFAQTLLLQQSTFPAVTDVASAARSFASVQLQTNNSLAVAEQSVGIAGSLIGVVAGFKSGDPWGAVQSITDVITGALGLGDILGGGPSAEDQIFDQIVALRQQVEDLRVEMNARFDVVDAKLDQVFDTMVAGFAELGDQIGDLQTDVELIAADIAQVRSSLDRIENALFGFAEELFLAELAQQTNLLLDYFNVNGISLPYSGASPSFISGANFFFTFATTTSKGQTFAGTPEDQTLAISLDNADAVLGSQAIARYLNDLRRVPPGLMDSQGQAVVGPLQVGRVAAPSAWAQGAAAYLQLARENPWSFAYQFAVQAASGNTPRIQDVIDDGERIVGLAEAIRSSATLFDGLLTNGRDAVADYQSATLDWLANYAEGRLSDAAGNLAVDPWGPLVQDTTQANGSKMQSVRLVDVDDVERTLAVDYSDQPLHGWGMATGPTLLSASFSGRTRAELANRNALQAALDSALEPQTEVFVEPLAGDDGRFGRCLFANISEDTFRARVSNFGMQASSTVRLLEFRIEVEINIPPFFRQWVPISDDLLPFDCKRYLNQIELAWNGADALGEALNGGDLSGSAFSTGTLVILFNDNSLIELPSRVVVTAEITFAGQQSLAAQSSALADLLAAERQATRALFLSELNDPVGSELDVPGQSLGNASALLDAYLTVGMADALRQSEVLRSAVRGQPSIAGLGFRPGDVQALVAYEDLIDDGAIGGVPSLGLTRLGQTLGERIDALATEIEVAVETPAPSYPYVEMILTELKALRDQAASLAVDETYRLDTPLNIGPAQGLLANDIGQPGVINDQELVIDLDFFGSPEAIAPKHGQLTVQADGGFTYVPDPGFSGEDRFSYRLRAQVGPDGPAGLAVSEPAIVVLRVEAPPVDRIFSDGFQ